MSTTATRIAAHRRQGLFPCEAEVARRLSQSPAEWTAKALVLERTGLPRIDPLMGGRYWPAVEAFWARRYGLIAVEISAIDGPENLNAFRDSPRLSVRRPGQASRRGKVPGLGL